MKTILCFGDSNTWGFDPEGILAPYPRRHSLDVRWTGVLARELGGEWRVIEEGQNGRTTVHEDPFVVSRNGRTYLPACLESHKPIDVVTLMLGTNDLKSTHNVPPGEIANGAAILARMILSSDAGPGNRPPKLLLICPPKIGDLSHLPDLALKIPDGVARSERFPLYFGRVAEALGCAYLNGQEVVEASKVDGIHLDATAHAKLGAAIAAKVQAM
ncbi:MAG: SGNH/GDSL hydrolase family protein [Prosthecobacter sp.]|nr:SGNH/GDSL hydrolase family protein [Prosthecobacter sp.]